MQPNEKGTKKDLVLYRIEKSTVYTGFTDGKLSK